MTRNNSKISKTSDHSTKSSLKMVVVGDGAVGKTSMLMTYVDHKFPEDYIPTIFENIDTVINVDNRSVKVNIWDTAGQEEFDRLRSLAYPNTNVFIVCYSVIRPESFQSVRTKWINEIRKHSQVPIVLVGTMIDMRNNSSNIEAINQEDNSNTPITLEIAEQWKDRLDGIFSIVECSAKSTEGLENVFSTAVAAAESILDNKEGNDDSALEILLQPSSSSRKGSLKKKRKVCTIM